MAYFLDNSERRGTCYFEWQKGNWFKEKIHWKEDSLVMEDSNFDDFLYDIIVSVIPQFDYYGENIITKEQWNAIKDKSFSIDGKRKEVIEEADAWVKETFKNHEHFSILGL